MSSYIPQKHFSNFQNSYEELSSSLGSASTITYNSITTNDSNKLTDPFSSTSDIQKIQINHLKMDEEEPVDEPVAWSSDVYGDKSIISTASQFHVFLDEIKQDTNERQKQQSVLDKYLDEKAIPSNLPSSAVTPKSSDTSKKTIHGIRASDPIHITIIGENPPKLLIPDPVIPESQRHSLTSNVEVVERIIYRDSEELIRDVLNDIIDELPTISRMTFDLKKLLEPKPEYTYYTPEEVVVHNTLDDCWVSYLGFVYDLTPLIKLYENTREIRPILAFAGKDISDWFDVKTKDIRHYIHPITGVRVPYLPHGRIPEIQPQCPATKWQSICPCNSENPEVFVHWWRDEKYKIGRLTERSRPIRIINTLTLDECTLTVCKEDKLSRIRERLQPFNSHAGSYTWKFNTCVLDMDKTLDENGIWDERDKFLDLFLPETTYVPAICLYFNDDFLWDYDSDEIIEVD